MIYISFGTDFCHRIIPSSIPDKDSSHSGSPSRKAHNPAAPIMPKVRKTKQSEEQKKLDTISRNIANYVGNSEGQERI